MDQQIRNHRDILEYKVIWEHQWLDMIKKNPFISYFVRHCCQYVSLCKIRNNSITILFLSYGPPIVQSTMSTSEAVDYILQGKIVGFVECLLYVPAENVKDYLDLPPIFVRETVKRKNLKGTQQEIAVNRGALQTGQETIMSKFSGDNLVIGTDLLIFYLNNGIKLKRLDKIIQFQENLAFGVSFESLL